MDGGGEVASGGNVAVTVGEDAVSGAGEVVTGGSGEVNGGSDAVTGGKVAVTGGVDVTEPPAGNGSGLRHWRTSDKLFAPRTLTIMPLLTA